MMQRCNVMQGTEKIGTVELEREGLYVRVFCQCDLSGEVMYDLMVQSQHGDICLGLLMPQKDQYTLEKRISVKALGQGKYTFFIKPHRENLEGKFIPIHPEEPFAYLNRLEQAFLACHNGVTGVVLPDKNNAEIIEN